MRHSGKLVILGILALALAAAGVSWWFRYSATHRAAEHWGPQAVRLIREAPFVKLYRIESSHESATTLRDAGRSLDMASGVEITKAPGLTHLRYALLEDRSYRWPAEETPADGQHWQWALWFEDAVRDEHVALFFSRDWRQVCVAPCQQVLSSEPIADGLATMLGEFTGHLAPSR